MNNQTFSFLIFFFLLFSSCGRKESPNLRFLIWGDPAEINTVKKQVDVFMSKYPGIKVEIISDSPAGYDEKLQMHFLQKNPPDVMYISREWFQFYAKNSLLENLDEYFKRDLEFNSADFFPEIRDSFKYSGSYYAVAKDFTPLVMYYNKNLFRKNSVAFPSDKWTREEFLSAAKKMTKDTDGDGTPDQWGYVLETWFGQIAPWIWQSGSEVYDSRKKSFVLLDSENFSKTWKAVQFLYDLMYTDKVSPAPATTKTTGTMGLFTSGKAAMYSSGRWACLSLKEITDFEWDIAFMPKDKSQATTVFTVGYGIASASRKKKEAWELVRHLVSRENQIEVAASGLAIPVRPSIAQSQHFLSTPKLSFKVDNMKYLQAVGHSKFMPSVTEWNEAIKIIDDELGMVFNKTSSVDTALENLKKNLKKFD